MTIYAAVQVRMGSSRLPGKVLAPVLGKPLLGHLIDRLGLCRQLDGVVVATSLRAENDAIQTYCESRGTPCFRGSEDDVLARMLGALASVGAVHGVEVFGDCPLIDPGIVDDMISRFRAEPGLDWLGNDLATTYPPGMEVEVFTVAALADAAARCADPAIREHGTLFIRQHADHYRIRNVEAVGLLRRPELELEVDTAEDLDVVTAILEHFADRPDVPLADLIAFLDSHPALKEKNAGVFRRWKEFRDG